MGELIGEMSVPIYFKPAENGNHLLEFNYLENFADAAIHLEDHLTGHQINLNEQDSYAFDAFTENDPHRFTLHFERSITGFSNFEVIEQDIQVIYRNGQLLITAEKGLKGGELTLIALNGQLLQQFSYSAGQSFVFDVFAYKNKLLIVRINDRNFQEVRKIFIE